MPEREPLPLLWFLTGTIGDALMAIALCNEIAELNPGSRSVLLVRRHAGMVADLASLVPSAHVETVSFSPLSVARLVAKFAQPWQVMSAWKSVGLRHTLRSFFLFNPRTRIVRFDTHQPATRHDDVAPYDMSKLVIDNFRVLAHHAGFATLPLGSPVSLPIAARMPSKFNLTEHSYMVLHPFGSNAIKSLPAEQCRGVLQALIAKFPQLSFVITCGMEDGPTAQALSEGLPRVTLAVGLPILEVAGLIERAVVFIGVDTGVTHLAAMMGQKVLALEHPTMPRWFPTYNPKTTMLLSRPDEREGVWGIDIETIVAKVTEIL